jgi:tetratricopeptide (TPR) repeat protein
MTSLSDVYAGQGQPAQAAALDSQILEIRRRVLGPEHPETLLSMSNLAADYHEQGRFSQAEALGSQAMEIRRRVLGPEHPDTLMTMSNLGAAYYYEGKYPQAEALLKQAREIQRRVLGPDHPDTRRSEFFLALDYQAQGKYPAVDALVRTALASSPKNPLSLGYLAWILVAAADPGQRRPAEALPLARRAVKAEPDNGDLCNALGLVEYRNNHWDEAISSLNRSVDLDKGAQPTDFFFLAMAHWRRGDKSEAEQFFQRGVGEASKKEMTDPQSRMFWSEAAGVLGKSGPPKAGLPAKPNTR